MKIISTFMLLATLLLPNVVKAADVYELNAAHIVSTIHPIHVYLADLLKSIEEKSEGRLKFNIFDNSTLVKGDGMYKAIKSGGADLVLLSASQLPADLSYSLTHDMSFLSSDALTGGILLWEMLKLPEVQKEIIASNSEVLWCASGDKPGLGSIKTQIKKMSDLNGKRVLIWQSNLSEEVKAWGGIPVHIPIPDTYMALQRGMGEVVYGAIPMFPSMKLQELLKYVTVMPSALGGMTWNINNQTMASIPEDLQKIIRDSTGLEATKAHSVAIRDSWFKDVETLRAAGVEVLELSTEDLTPWKEKSIAAMNNYWEDILKKAGDKNPQLFIEKVRALALDVEAGSIKY